LARMAEGGVALQNWNVKVDLLGLKEKELHASEGSVNMGETAAPRVNITRGQTEPVGWGGGCWTHQGTQGNKRKKKGKSAPPHSDGENQRD